MSLPILPLRDRKCQISHQIICAQQNFKVMIKQYHCDTKDQKKKEKVSL